MERPPASAPRRTQAHGTPPRSRSTRGRPVWERGRLGRLASGLVEYARTAWWGVIGAHVSEDQPLEVSQAVILRTEAKDGASSRADTTQILLSIRSDLFGWELPGGTIEPGEDPRDALVREVWEETGLDVEIEAEVGDWTRAGFRPHTAYVFRVRVLAGDLTSSHETPRLTWFDLGVGFGADSDFDPDRLPAALFPWYREPIKRALAAAPPTSVTEVQGARWIAEAMWIDLKMRWKGLPPK